jgi:hypothetical protein
MQDCGAMLWSKLDSDILKAGGDKFEKQRKKLGQTYGDHIWYIFYLFKFRQTYGKNQRI